MKSLFRAVLFVVLTAALTIAAFAQNKESKDEQFSKIVKLSQTKKPEDQEKAYQQSKAYLAQYGTDNDEKVKKLKDFVEKYRLATFNKMVDEQRMTEAVALGKDILAAEPENSYVPMNLAFGGYELYTKKKDKSFSAEATGYAKQTLSLFEAGKLPKSFEPLKDQAEATAMMYYVIGTFAIDNDPKTAAANFYKAIQPDSKIKNISYPYYIIAYYYERVYEAGAKDYQTKHGAKTSEDAAMKADQEKLNNVVDRMMDAYARAVKVAEAENNPQKDTWKQRLTDIYKYRKGSDAGLTEMMASVTTTPIPDPATL